MKMSTHGASDHKANKNKTTYSTKYSLVYTGKKIEK